MTFSWRPATSRQRTTYNEFISDLRVSRERQEERAAEVLCKHILEWDITDKDGKIAPIDSATVMKLHPELFNRLFAIAIRLSDVPDEDLNGDWLGPEVNAVANDMTLEAYLDKNS